MRKKHVYMVGWDTEKDVVYGQSNREGMLDWAIPMTLSLAKREIKRFPAEPVAYKLVKVDLKKEKP